MGVLISFQLDGVQQLSAELGIDAQGLTDYSEPMAEIGSSLLKTWQLNFDTRGGELTPGGWAPRTRNYPWPLLEKTGRLRSGFYANNDQNSVTLGNDVPYYKYHQLGTTRLPQRIMQKLDDARRTMIIKTIQAYIVKITRSR